MIAAHRFNSTKPNLIPKYQQKQYKILNTQIVGKPHKIGPLKLFSETLLNLPGGVTFCHLSS